MALVAGIRLLHRHRHPFRPRNMRMRDAHGFLYKRRRVRIVAVRAGDAIETVRRRMPGHRGRALVTLNAEVGACFRADIAVWIVAGFA